MVDIIILLELKIISNYVNYVLCHINLVDGNCRGICSLFFTFVDECKVIQCHIISDGEETI